MQLSDSEVNAYIGGRIRQMRKRTGLSAREVGKHTGISGQQLYKFEMGTNRISASNLFRLANFFNVEPNFFYEGLPGLAEGDVNEDNVGHLIQNFLKVDTQDRGAMFKGFVSTIKKQGGSSGG